jgi:Protein of unknown function (DUF2695)
MVKLRLVTDGDRPGPPDEPAPDECLACFVDRMMRLYGCANRLTWAMRWRDRRAPRATALRRRLEARGGFCDCEVLMNVHVRPEWLPGPWGEVDSRPATTGEGTAPPCFGVRRGSTQACAHWTSPY